VKEVYSFATQLFSTPVTSSNLRNHAPLFTLRSSAFYWQPRKCTKRPTAIFIF